MKHTERQGFTLIELSLVLVIVGLLVGGVVAGRSLINSAAIRSQIAQLEQYKTGLNSFVLKYNCLPGDCAKAADYGFKPRGSLTGQGDGDGYLLGHNGNVGGEGSGYQIMGETATFWVDLSAAHLIADSLTLASPNTCNAPCSLTNMTADMIASFLPRAKLAGNFIYVHDTSGGASWWCPGWCKGFNVMTIAQTTGSGSGGRLSNVEGMRVAEAYAIDTKLDDGLPQLGKIQATFTQPFNTTFAGGGSSTTSAVTPSATTCFDNGGVSGTHHYSMSQRGGAGVNCALSMRLD